MEFITIDQACKKLKSGKLLRERITNIANENSVYNLWRKKYYESLKKKILMKRRYRCTSYKMISIFFTEFTICDLTIPFSQKGLSAVL